MHRYYHYARRPKNVSEVRPRLNADELEEKLLSAFREALKTEGYFKGLESTLKTVAESRSRVSRGEHERVKEALQEATNRISAIWANQGRMELGEGALRLASDELNRLATEKQKLEKQLAQFDAQAFDIWSAQDQALFVENQFRWCLQGWAKANPYLRKRMLRRVVKEIVVTHDEMLVAFWTSHAEQENSPQDLDGIPKEGSEKILNFRKRSLPVPDRNLYVGSSGDLKIGSEGRT